MLSLTTYFSTLAPEIYGTEETHPERAKVEAFYPIAQEQVKASTWGNYTNKAVVLLSLHLYARNVLDSSNSNTGPLIAASTGEFSSKTWANPTGGQAMNEDYATTKWGLQYVALRRVAYGGQFMPAAGRA